MKPAQQIVIKEKSWIARMAAKKIRQANAAIVVGNTIYLHGVSKEIFLQNEAWLRHELKHVEQFRRHGFTKFVFLYLLESVRNGYYHNRFEIEARAAEQPE